MKVRFGCLSAFACLLVSQLASAQDATSAGNLSAPYPTFNNLSLVWEVSGDDNLNGRVSVRYRKKGEPQFRDGLDLYRVPAGQNEGFSWTNKHAGSLWGLAAGTEYDIELTLTDPDGGDASETLAVATRAVPQIAPGGAQLDATPATIDSILAASAPGNVILLADGVYTEIVLPNDGAEGAPIVLQSKNPSGAVVEGDVRIDGRSHVIVEGLTVHGKIKFNDASNIVVRGCAVQTDGDGIVSYGSGLTNGWIVDNTISGPTEWKESALGVNGDNLGEGIQITGPGNVIAFNKVKGFRDCVSLLEDGEAVNQVSVDIYGNDLEACADDAIEADFAMGNVRVYHNRIAHSFMGISSQPSLGGPTYFVRNVLYNIVYQAFKLQRTSSGDVGFHNTIIKSGDAFSVNTDTPIYRAHFLNNLFLGGPGATYNGYDSGPGKVIYLPSADSSSSFNYNGYASESGQVTGQIGSTKFANFSELTSLTSEKNAELVGLDTFAAPIVYPSAPFTSPMVPGFALAPSGSAVDKGTTLPNINDGFAGTAPDLGALEVGQPEPVYGPGGVIGTGGGGTGGSGGSATGGSETGGSGGGQAGSGGGGSPGETPGSNGCSCRVGDEPLSESSMGRSVTWTLLAALGVLFSRKRRPVRRAVKFANLPRGVFVFSSIAALFGASCNLIFGIESGIPKEGSGGGGTTGSTSGTGAGGDSIQSSSSTGGGGASAASDSSSSTGGTGGSTGGTAGTGGVPIETGLAMLLHMDEADWSGVDSVSDASGNGNHGTVMGDAVPDVNGKIGGAGAFGGAGWIVVSDSTSLHPTTEVTCAAWVYPTALTNGMGGFPAPGILSKRQEFGINVAFTLFIWENNNAYVDIQDDRVNTQAAFTNDTWQHIAFVYNGNESQAFRLKIYVNGALDSVHPTVELLDPNTQDVQVGGLPGGGQPFIGKIDEVAIWTRALSEAEIQSVYTNGVP